MCGCSGTENSRDAATLHIRLKRDPPTLDPARIVDLDGARIAARLFSGLVAFSDSLDPVPDTARSWSVSPDGLRYVFELERNVRFFNGRELTAGDVRYSFERVLDPRTRSPRTWVLSRIRGARAFMQGREARVAGIEVRGPYEIVITLEEPFSPFIKLLGLTTAYIVPAEEVRARGQDYGFHASGAGPFVLKRWQHSECIELERNEYYRAAEQVRTDICYRIVPEDFTASVEFERGRLDVLPEIMASEFDRFGRDPKWQGCISISPGLNTYYLGLNCRRPPFTDPRVRQALNHAVDRKKILAALIGGRGTPARGPLPDLLRDWEAPPGYDYDPRRARDLLAQAGYENGFAMQLYQTTDIESLDICQALQAYLKAVGIDLQIVQLEWGTFLESIARGEADSFWLSWWADYPDAENFLFPLFHSDNHGSGGNRSGFSDPAVDRLIEGGMASRDDTKRAALFREAEHRIVAGAPWVFCWHKARCSIHQPRVRGYRQEPLAVMEKGLGISLGE